MAADSSSFHIPVKLSVCVQRAVNLIASDPNGKSDPYCVIHLGSPGEQLHKTEVVNNTLSPEWNDECIIQSKQLSPFVFTSADSLHLYGFLVVDVWDHDTANPDDFLGRVMLSLGEIPSDTAKELWYPLMRRNTKDGSISGSLKLKTQLLVEEGKIVEHEKMSDYVYTKCKSRGFHLSLCSEKDIVEFPGRTEFVEMAFSRVMIDISSHHCTAQVFLTNFRLIILSTSGHSKSHRYHGRGASIDLSMWIALNNIMNVDMTNDSVVLHHHKSRQRKTRTVSFTIHCYDVRVVKLTFISDVDGAELEDTRSPEFLASTSSCQTEKGGGGEGTTYERARIAQVLKDYPTQSPKLLKGVFEKGKGVGGVGGGANNFDERSKSESSKNPHLFRLPGDFTKSLTTIEVIPEESPEHRITGQEDPFEAAEFRGRSRSAALTQEPKELLNVPGQYRLPLDDNGPSAVGGEESCVSLFSMDKCSDLLDDDFDLDNLSYELVFGDEDETEGDRSIYFGASEVIDGSCATNTVTSTNESCAVNPNGTTPSIQFPISNSAQLLVFHARLEHLILNVPDFPPATTFVERYQGYIQLRGWDFYNFPKEMDRQGVSEDKWSLSVLNGPQYELCSTYPQLMYVPKNIEKSILQESAKFRSKNRLPCLVWVDKKYHNFMLRCAQPLTGKAGRRSTQDEQLIEAAINAGPPDGHMFIYDARTFSAATGNKMMGKGTEIITGYPQSKLQYLAIPNIHAVRESYDSLRSLCLSMTSGKWHSSLENTQWLNYLSLILKGSTMIARYMKLQRGNTLVHCSDGWDRTSQLTSLSQLMMDPYYRTMEGFQTLVDKEWLSFGHKFQQRLGHPNHLNERSPIFFQFLDCVHQILMQSPQLFEFQLSYLLCIADHLNTAWFGTFLCNCDKERHNLSLYATTASIWAHLHAEKDRFINPDFVESKQPIFPVTNIRRLRLWEEYFLRYDFTTYTLRGGREVEEISPNHSPSIISHGQSLRGSWTSEAVVWMADDKTNECCYCQQKFSPFRRKHHCRACGRIFCNDCSKNRMALAHLGYFTPERICDECYRKLNGAQSSIDEEDEFVLVTKVKQ